MKIGYYILDRCMTAAPIVIALMPWFLMLDSSVRMKKVMDFGLVKVIALPRHTFNYARIQCNVICLVKGYKGPTEFTMFDF